MCEIRHANVYLMKQIGFLFLLFLLSLNMKGISLPGCSLESLIKLSRITAIFVVSTLSALIGAS